ncbi:MAG: tetratricopeptide repeat protein [Acidobacteria bacterium]|uniref:Tetratricopeptide repeat protein n=1 Tax=Candidatus Polarisedimenticola svalbardensis TaxID=2886004 RepID=A0A8J7CE01_9BACT|nr:tetratricopeptide repeat protein [Candidatus Polarisedimenticola svalbardensis]
MKRLAAHATFLTVLAAALAFPASPLIAGNAGEIRVESFRLLNEGVTDYNRGRYAEAVEKLRRSSAMALNSFRAYHFLGLALIGTRQYPEALDALEIALDLDPNHLTSLVAYGDAYLKMGETDEAVAAYYRALKIRSEFPNALDGIARGYEAKAQTDKAEEFYQRAIASNRGYAPAYTHLGDLYLRIGRYQDAVRLLSEAVAVRPDYAPGLNRLARGYTHLRMYNEAVATIEKAIELAPGRPEHPTSLGMIQMELGLTHRAEESFGRALELDPDLASAHHGLAELLRRQGRYPEAALRVDQALADARLRPAGREELEAYREALKAEAELYTNLNAAVAGNEAAGSELISLAGIHASRKEWNKAAHYLRLAGPQADQAVLGYYLLMGGEYSRAVELYGALPGLNDDTGLLLNQGIALANLGRDREAAAAYRRVLELDEGNSDAWLYLGNALVRLREDKEAVSAFRRFLQAGGKHTASEQVRRILQQLTGEEGS